MTFQFSTSLNSFTHQQSGRGRSSVADGGGGGVYSVEILICSTGLAVSAAVEPSLPHYRFPFDCSYRCVILDVRFCFLLFANEDAFKVGRQVDPVTARRNHGCEGFYFSS